MALDLEGQLEPENRIYARQLKTWAFVLCLTPPNSSAGLIYQVFNHIPEIFPSVLGEEGQGGIVSYEEIKSSHIAKLKFPSPWMW